MESPSTMLQLDILLSLKTVILEREKNKFKCMVLEGMHIYSNKDSVVNINSGLTIENCWAPFVKELGFPGKGQ